MKEFFVGATGLREMCESGYRVFLCGGTLTAGFHHHDRYETFTSGGEKDDDFSNRSDRFFSHLIDETPSLASRASRLCDLTRQAAETQLPRTTPAPPTSKCTSIGADHSVDMILLAVAMSLSMVK